MPGDGQPEPTIVAPPYGAVVSGPADGRAGCWAGADRAASSPWSPGTELGGGCLAGSRPYANPAIAPSAANAAAASRTSLSPLAVPARAAWVTAPRAAGGAAAATRVPAPEATAAASRPAAPGGAGRPARACRVAAVTREAYRAPNTATPVAVPTWRSVFTRPAAIPARAGSTAASAAEARPVEVMPRPIPARIKPDSSTSQVDVAVRWAIETSPAAAAAMATPSSTRIATVPLRRPVRRATVNETSDSGRNRSPAWTGE